MLPRRGLNDSDGFLALGCHARLLKLEAADAERVMRANYMAPSLLMWPLAGRFEARGSGTLVAPSSVAVEGRGPPIILRLWRGQRWIQGVLVRLAQSALSIPHPRRDGHAEFRGNENDRGQGPARLARCVARVSCGRGP